MSEVKTLLGLTGASPYSVPKASLCWAFLPEREVRSTWLKQPNDLGHERYAYFTPDYAIGSTSADYGGLANNQDMLLTAELPSSPDSAVISVLPDYLDAPGTSVKAGDFRKVTHLRLSPAAAQKGGAMLSLLRVPAKDPDYVIDNHPVPVVNLSTNVIFPAQADEIPPQWGAGGCHEGYAADGPSDGRREGRHGCGCGCCDQHFGTRVSRDGPWSCREGARRDSFQALPAKGHIRRAASTRRGASGHLSLAFLAYGRADPSEVHRSHGPPLGCRPLRTCRLCR